MKYIQDFTRVVAVEAEMVGEKVAKAIGGCHAHNSNIEPLELLRILNSLMEPGNAQLSKARAYSESWRADFSCFD